MRRLRDRSGQTFILVMTVTAMAAVLGVMAMSGALMSVRLRGMKRVSDKNFYRLELAAEEIRAGAARDYAEAAGAYASGDWQQAFLRDHVEIRDLSVLYETRAALLSSRWEAARSAAAEYLAGFSATIPTAGMTAADRTEELAVSVEDVGFDGDGNILFSGVHYVLINYERDAQTEIVCDLVFHADRAPGAGTVDEVVGVAGWQRIG